MRINFNQDIDPTEHIVFEKSTDDKHYMKEDNILKCFNVKAGETQDPEATEKAKAIANIKFEEVFDPDNFAENDALSMYMGLGTMLSEGKSVMLLTYGYSGVGKTFTLFGTKGVEGMLQSTLNGITGASKYQMKAFELYGLGVPYKFYWESNNFTHNLYKYELTDTNSTNIHKEPVEFKDNRKSYKQFKEEGKTKDDETSFNYLLNEDNHYTDITSEHISNFEEIVTNIDNIRRENGRIKSTINNPESSRSIMIYDFKITISINGIEKYPRLVVMDLPGKENLYQTYCERDFNGIYEPRDRFVNHRTGPEKDDVNETQTNVQSQPLPKQSNLNGQANESTPAPSRRPSTAGSEGQSSGVSGANIGPENQIRVAAYNASIQGKKRGGANPADSNKKYDEKMIKAMMYINPLWLGTIPETAEHFDVTQKTLDSHLINTKIGINVNTLTSYSLDQTTKTYEKIEEYRTIKEKETPPIKIHENYVVKNNSENTSHYSIYQDTNKKSLYGLTSRAVANITNWIKDPGGLETLGGKINLMLNDSEARNKRYGYAGLEGIYINENILGLLQVLAEKIQLSRLGKTKDKIVDVVCSQSEVYRNILKGTDSGLTPISWELLEQGNHIKDDKIKEGAPILVQDNEFISQILFLRGIIKSSKDIGESFFNPVETDKYKNYFRDNIKLKFNNDTRGLSQDLEDIEKNWINNYNYNKIFNIENPPIKSILAPYLDDPTFQNFYLFFVTSNNVKEAPDGNNINTCGKQIQLMYDTRHFMEVIAKSDPAGVQCPR